MTSAVAQVAFLGDLLVQHGRITEAQRDEILQAQAERPRPFGLLAEQMFGVSPDAVEQAWAAQFAQVAERVDPTETPPESNALGMIERRQAWQFDVLPMRVEGGELIAATTLDSLPRALRFTGWRLTSAVRFVICNRDELEEALAEHYPMAGLPR